MNRIKDLYKKYAHSCKRQILLLLLRVIRSESYPVIMRIISNTVKAINTIRITIFTALLLSIVILCASKSFLSNGSIPGTIASIIGTVLALVFTLSIIPIQKAVSDWSAAISRLYIKDKKVVLAFIFITLLLVCALLLPTESHFSPVLSILFLAISLDVVRWYYVHICQLLDPNIAIRKLEAEIIKSIGQYKHAIEKTAARLRLFVPYKELGKFDKSSAERVAHSQTAGYVEQIKLTLNSIAEFSLKALANNDSILVGVSLTSISSVIQSYVDLRKNNLLFNRSPETLFLVQETDADSLLNHAYDLLKKVGLAAAEKGDEAVCESVFKEYCNIALHVSTLNDETAFMVSSSMSYMRIVLNACIRKGMFDAPYSAGLKLCKLANNMPDSARYESTYQPIFELVQIISIYYVALGQSSITNELCKRISIFLLNLYKRSYWQFSEVFELILGLYGLIVYSVLKVGKESYQGFVLQTAITNSYSSISEVSLSRLILLIAETDVERYTGENEDTESKTKSNMRDMLGSSEILWSHLKELANENDFGSNRILRDILECVFDSLRVFVWYAAAQDEDNRAIIVKKMIIPFFWLMSSYFNSKQNIDSDFEKQAANSLTHVALNCVSFEWNNAEIIDASSRAIRSILENHCKTLGVGNGHALVYFLKLLWRLRYVAEKYNLSHTATQIDALIAQKPASVEDDVWAWCQEQLGRKKKQLTEYIKKDDSRYPNAIDSSLDAFMDALRSKLRT